MTFLYIVSIYCFSKPFRVTGSRYYSMFLCRYDAHHTAGVGRNISPINSSERSTPTRDLGAASSSTLTPPLTFKGGSQGPGTPGGDRDIHHRYHNRHQQHYEKNHRSTSFASGPSQRKAAAGGGNDYPRVGGGVPNTGQGHMRSSDFNTGGVASSSGRKNSKGSLIAGDEDEFPNRYQLSGTN